MLRGLPTPSHEDAIDVSFFADAFRDSAVPSLVLAPDSTVLFWNTAMERLFGWSAEEAVGRPLPLVPQERLEEHLEFRRRTLAGEGHSHQRVTRRDKQGRPVELSLSTWPIRGADGRVTAIAGIYVYLRAEELRVQRSLANQQLEELERLYATAPIGLGFLNTDLRFVRVNERMAQIDGMSAEAHVGKRLADIVPEAAASLEGVYRDVMATGTAVIERELRAPTPALPGVPRDWQVSAYPLKHPDGTMLGVTFAVSDITERKRWSDELRRQEALLRLVIDGLPGMVLYIDRDYRYRFANRAAGEWFQRPPSDFDGREISEVLGESTFEDVRESVVRALGGEEVVDERHIRYPDRERDVNAHYVPDRAPNGEVRGMVALVQDVTEQKQAERALRDSEERFRRMVEIAAEGLWIVDAAAMTIFVNNRMAAILGYNKEEMLGRPCFDFFDPEERERARLEFQDFAIHKTLTPEPGEFRGRRKDGSTVWLDITGTPIIDDAGTFTGVLKMCTDVTERKKNEQRLRQAQKLESLGIMAGGAAHDFNNLLTSILGNTSLVLDTLELGSRSRAMLQDVVTASEGAARLTRQMLTYAGKDQARLQPVDVAAAAREVVPLLSASIPKIIRLSLELEEGTPLVEADPAQFQQVMMNLVINAAESIPERTPGEVRIGVGRHRLTPEDYRDAVMPIEDGDRDYVSFSVTDNGSGMDPATQARIFDPFFSTKFAGRGLGLAAVLGIVRGHGGTLTVRTAPQKGSVFTVFLPASHAARPAETTPAVAPEIAAAGVGTILFVDDEPALRSLAQRTLERLGYRVLPAADGREAIAVLKANPEVRAVVLDLAMPEMTGDIVGPILRSLRPDVPLILSSGYPASDVLERVGPGVAAAFLQKPYQAGMLAAKVDEVLRIGPGS
jgi:PAS domain S-box-containing protein